MPGTGSGQSEFHISAGRICTRHYLGSQDRRNSHGRAIGILDESDVLVKVHRDPVHFNDPVKKAMTSKLEILSPTATIKDLLDVFDRGRVAIVMEDDKFLGLVTRSDLLSYLRLHMAASTKPNATTIRFSAAPSSANKRHGRFQKANITAALAIRSQATPNTLTLANRSTAKAGPR